MKGLSRVCAVVLLGLGTALMPLQAPATETVAAVSVDYIGRQGQGGVILARLNARCVPGYVLQDIVVEFSQGDLTASTVIVSGVPCDGAWHKVRFSSPEGFEPGAAHAFARMTVISAATGDPAPQAVDDQPMWVRAAVALSLPKAASLTPRGNVWITVYARCDRPWVESELVLELSQGTQSATVITPTNTVPCDEKWRAFSFKADGVAPFQRGPATLFGSLCVLDPVSFDPVACTQPNRTIWLS